MAIPVAISERGVASECTVDGVSGFTLSIHRINCCSYSLHSIFPFYVAFVYSLCLSLVLRERVNLKNRRISAR